MADKGEGHPLSIPDETTRFRQSDTSQEMGGEEPWNPEEGSDTGPDTPVNASRNAPSKKELERVRRKRDEGFGRRGGGLGFSDIESDQGYAATDPETLMLRREYEQAQINGFDGTFAEYLEAPESEKEWKQAEEQNDERERKAELRRKEEEKKVGFHLVLRPKALEKVATAEEQKKTREFLRTWNGNDGPVLWAGLELGKSKDDPRVRAITGVSVVVEKDGKMVRTTIDSHIFRNVFEGVMGSKKPGTDITNGLEFVNPDSGERQKLYPGKTPDEVADVLSAVKIGGIALPPETKYFIGNDNQKEK